MDICDLAVSDLEEGEDIYLITWAPNPRKMDYRSKTNYMNHIWLVFYGINQVWDKFCICPEINHESGAIHYHGWYTMKDFIKWFKVYKPRLNTLGFTKINLLKHIDKRDEAFKYYTKEIDITKEVVYPIPIPFSHLNYKNVINAVRVACKWKKPKREQKIKSLLPYIK